MEKFFKKDPIWFAVIWIIAYVVGFSSADLISESIGIPKLITCIFGLLLTVIALNFIKKNSLKEYFGLCKTKGDYKGYLYFVPLIIISSVNLWNGVVIANPIKEIILFVISMCFVAILEEIIFRGFLFKGMCHDNVKTAIIVSSLTFGIGHIVNLLMGAPVMDTMLQLMYASAIGFTYTALLYVSGSILPCIISHAVVNSMSIFAVAPSDKMNIIIAVIQTVLGVSYGLWLLNHKNNF